jgi:hypothetical protein
MSGASIPGHDHGTRCLNGTSWQLAIIAIEEPAEADQDTQVAVHLTGGGQQWVVRLEREPLYP